MWGLWQYRFKFNTGVLSFVFNRDPTWSQDRGGDRGHYVGVLSTKGRDPDKGVVFSTFSIY